MGNVSVHGLTAAGRPLLEVLGRGFACTKVTELASF